VQAAGLKNVFIAGADADAANANFVCEGKQSVEILKDIKPLAEKAAQVAASLATGKPVEGRGALPGRTTPAIAVPVCRVDQSNAKSLVIDSGFHAASAAPACAKK